IPVPHQDPAKIRVATKSNPHHVINLTFVPIGSAPDPRYAGRFPFFLRNRSFETQILMMAIAIEMVHKSKPGIFAVIIKTGNIDKVIEPQFSLGIGAYLGNSFGIRDSNTDFAAKLNRLPNQTREPRPKLIRQFNCRHATFFNVSKAGSLATFSCSFSK